VPHPSLPLARAGIFVSGSKNAGAPPFFASLFSIFYPQNIVCIELSGQRKPLLFNTLQDCSQDIPYKGVTGKIFRNKDLPDGHVVSAVNLRVLKDRVLRPEHRTGGAGDWLPRSQCTVRSELDRQENALQNTEVTADSQNGEHPCGCPRFALLLGQPGFVTALDTHKI
jgi:hypothetical protein